MNDKKKMDKFTEIVIEPIRGREAELEKCLSFENKVKPEDVTLVRQLVQRATSDGCEWHLELENCSKSIAKACLETAAKVNRTVRVHSNQLESLDYCLNSQNLIIQVDSIEQYLAIRKLPKKFSIVAPTNVMRKISGDLKYRKNIISRGVMANDIYDLTEEEVKKMKIDRIEVINSLGVPKYKDYYLPKEFFYIQKLAYTFVKDIKKDIPDIEKFLILYKEMGERIDYDFKETNGIIEPLISNHNLYGSIVQNRAVCEGIAKSLSEILYVIGIESVPVYGNLDVKQQEKNKTIDAVIVINKDDDDAKKQKDDDNEIEEENDNDQISYETETESKDENEKQKRQPVSIDEKDADSIHAWTKVKIDGKWYNCDLTNDLDNIVMGRPMDLCLLSDEEMEKKGFKPFKKERPATESYDQERLSKFLESDHTPLAEMLKTEEMDPEAIVYLLSELRKEYPNGVYATIFENDEDTYGISIKRKLDNDSLKLISRETPLFKKTDRARFMASYEEQIGIRGRNKGRIISPNLIIKRGKKISYSSIDKKDNKKETENERV